MGGDEAAYLAVAAQARQSETHVELGQLGLAEDVARSGLLRAEQAGDRQTTWYSHGTLAWPIALQGRLDEALEHYGLGTEIRGDVMAGPIAVCHILTLWWAGDLGSAGRLLEQNLFLAEQENDRDVLAQLARVKGELDANTAEDPELVIAEFQVAAARARELPAPQPLIQALTALGAAIAAFAGEADYNLDQARPILDEALRLTGTTGMRGFEPAVRIGLAHLNFRQQRQEEADAHIARAEALATEFGNAWDRARLERLRDEGARLRTYALAPARVSEFP